MKNFILNFKASIRFFTSIIISREFAVIYCLLGTISQISHTYFLIESISSLEGIWRMTQATMLSVFISSSLFYFVAIGDNADKSEAGIKEYKKVMLAVNLFTFIEIIINIYYYTRHLLIDQKEYQILDYVFAILVSCLIPITIKLYSSHIRAKEWIIAIEHEQRALVDNLDSQMELSQDTPKMKFEEDDVNELEEEDFKQPIENEVLVEENHEEIHEELTEDKVLEMVKPMIESFQKELKESGFTNKEEINDMIESRLKNFNVDIDKQISDSYQRNQELFLKQFENKLKMLSQEYLNKVKQD